MFSFDPLLPSAKDRVRLALGDTVDPGLLSDETINVTITASGEAEATARLAEALASRFAQEPDSLGVDGLTISWRERVKTWLELAARVRGVAAGGPTGSASRSTIRDELLAAEYERPASWVWGD